ncbi:uncharacterized protein CTHT_0023920 [Thermochaetoides thermophila DSM 1495]|uniref:Oxidoreductase-like protein n=1 Tax=Chaetomium thermophilum (strain DSM 1495 / CBS 144.50 / IMI 039719) TaxID=759272 RepID=G0S533_CHATD|nr:hypothetical protein CTHT_0023920 [Thermochaetoides thermophila DSM 1495]EGS20558.1 hypothetical protein CTHT_0023920 [Thermochaetoides thermophila DSM 1495]
MDTRSVPDTASVAGSDVASSKTRLQLPPSCGPPEPGQPTKQMVWIVFGGTGHMGRSLVKSALSHGDLVTTVGRVFETSPEDMAKVNSDTCLGLLCDVRDGASVRRVIERTIARFGRVDCIANCSGYGVIGACEDQDEHELRNQFETNFMGTLHIVQASLPYFRQQNGGRYLIFSSTSGALGVPGLGPYCATKYAVEGFVEAMLYEVDSFNIKATLVEPGLVRRDEPADPKASPLPTWGHFLIKPASEAYSHATSPALHAQRMVQWLGDRQPTSAVKCAELVWQLAHCSYPPLRLLLGSYAIESIRDRLRSVTEELEDWKHLNFPPPPDAPGAEELLKKDDNRDNKAPESQQDKDKEENEKKEEVEQEAGDGGDDAMEKEDDEEKNREKGKDSKKDKPETDEMDVDKEQGKEMEKENKDKDEVMQDAPPEQPSQEVKPND